MEYKLNPNKDILTKSSFYAFSLTWGILMNLVGSLVALGLLLAGCKPSKHGWCVCFSFGANWGGLSMGLFIFTDAANREATKWHEHGHAIQNCFYGPIQVFITIASALRYHNLRRMRKKGLETPAYDSVWYEAEATHLGSIYKRIIEGDKTHG